MTGIKSRPRINTFATERGMAVGRKAVTLLGTCHSVVNNPSSVNSCFIPAF